MNLGALNGEVDKFRIEMPLIISGQPPINIIFYQVEVKARVETCFTRTGVVLVAVIRAVEAIPLIT